MTSATAQLPSIDLPRIRQAFPILQKPGLVYLDNGATTQKPLAVIEALRRYYSEQNANIHRGVYKLSQDATAAYDDARKTVARFINASEPAEAIFTRGTTEGINLIAATFGRTFLKAGDEIIVSQLEHHSNIVPWQLAAGTVGATLKVIPIDTAGNLRLDLFAQMLNARTKLVAVTHASNALGTVNDVAEICRLAHATGAVTLIDGAQWVGHHRTDVQKIGCDFYAFSGHKLFGPTGIGVLWGRRALLDALPPYQGGGDMIEHVSFEKTTYAPLPSKFEAGTPHIAGAIGLAAAIDYVQSIGLDAIEDYEHSLLEYAVEKLSAVPGLRIVGMPVRRSGVISFVIENPTISTLDVGTLLDRRGIAVRTGHHCCQPLMDALSLTSTARASFAFYNTPEDVDALAGALNQIVAEKTARMKSTATAPAQSVGELKFALPAAPSVEDAANGLAATFDFLDNRDDRSTAVIELGDDLPAGFEPLKALTQRVPGCMSEVYLLSRRVPGKPDRIEFAADANADIVRGLIALLQQLFSGQRAAEVLAFDIEAFFARIGLDQFISSQRRNGLAGMVRRLRSDAASIANRDDIVAKTVLGQTDG